MRWVANFFYALGSLFSRCFNALALGGSIYRTTSAALYVNATDDPRWVHWRDLIDGIAARIPLLGEYDHCAASWDKEVERARQTLETEEKIRARQNH